MNAFALLVFVGWVSSSCVHGWEELDADNGLYRGYWGDTDECDDGSTFALDFKFEKMGQLDNTCGNSIKLFCHDGTGQIGDYITSTEGNYGDWQGIRNCPKNTTIVGFRLRVLEDQGTWGDDQGVDNVQVRCSDGTVLDGMDGVIPPTQNNQEAHQEWNNEDAIHEKITINGREVEVIHPKSIGSSIYGEWGSWAICSYGSVVGIQTRVEQGHPFEDDAGLCDVRMYCQ